MFLHLVLYYIKIPILHWLFLINSHARMAFTWDQNEKQRKFPESNKNSGRRNQFRDCVHVQKVTKNTFTNERMLIQDPDKDWHFDPLKLTHLNSHSSFSQTHKVGNVGIIANFVFANICCLLLSLHQLMLVNKGIHEDHILRSNALLDWLLVNEITKTKWQCWHSCIAEKLWKTLLLDMTVLSFLSVEN